MINKDLFYGVDATLKTAAGQLKYVQDNMRNPEKVIEIVNQLKAVQALLTKATSQLLDDSYRKALAQQIVKNRDSCPGNCGNEEEVESLVREFPIFKKEDIPFRLNQSQRIYNEMEGRKNDNPADNTVQNNGQDVLD